MDEGACLIMSAIIPSNGHAVASALNENVVKITRGRVDSIKVYEVTESEFEELSSGMAINHFFEVMIASVSIGASFLASLIASPHSGVTRTVFVVITVGAFMASVVFFVIWAIMKNAKVSVIQKIRARASGEQKPDINNSGSEEKGSIER